MSLIDRLFFQAVLTVVIGVLFAAFPFASIAQGEPPLKELDQQDIRQDQAIDQERSEKENDQQKLDQDRQKYASDRQAIENYIRQVQARLQQAEAARPGVELKIKQAGMAFKSPADLKKALNTPGTNLYVLNRWLENETKMRTEAPARIADLRLCLQRDLSLILQDLYDTDQDNASLTHDISTNNLQKSLDAGKQREEANARYWQNRYAPQYDPCDANAAFDNDYYNPGWGYWYQVPRNRSLLGR